VTITRRAACAFIGRSLLVGEVGAAFRGVPAPAMPAQLGTVDFQLSWLTTAQFAGSFIAQSRGLYQAQGLTVKILPGGPDVAVAPLIVAGKALVGLSSVSGIAQARLNGAPLKIIAAGLQQNPEVILSPAAKPVKTPHELIGKRFGIASADLVDAQAFLQINHVDPSSLQIVPVQFDPAPLALGEVDALFSYATDEAITLAVRGVPVHSLRLEDFGDTGLYQVYAVHERSLADGPTSRCAIRTSVRAWWWNVSVPISDSR
jgi:NitT/TauT family transport system substrate-binding protein